MLDSARYSISLPTQFETDDEHVLEALRTLDIDRKELIRNIEDTISKHTRDISRHHEALAFYKGHLNALKPSINTILPQEILCRIFYFHAPHSQVDPRPFSRLALVCRYWKNVLVSSPDIFSSIHLPSKRPEWLAECLRYSRQVPLDVLYCPEVSKPNDVDQWLLFLPHITHTRSLKISADITFLPQSYWPRSTLLTKLSFVHKGSSSSGMSHLVPIIDDIFSSLPNLLELRSDTTVLGWDWTNRTLPATLQSLDVKHRHPRTPSLSELSTTIQYLSALRQLTLTRLTVTHYSLPTRPLNRIHPLKLGLQGHMDPCTRLLSFLRAVQKLDLNVSLAAPGGRLELNPDMLWDSLSRTFESQGRIHQESYTILLRLFTDMSDNFYIGLHAASSLSNPTVSRQDAGLVSGSESMLYALKPFTYNIAFTLSKDQYSLLFARAPADCMSIARHFYGGLMPLFPRIQTVMIFNRQKTLQHDYMAFAWDAIVSNSANIRCVRMVWGRTPITPINEDHGSIFDLPLTLGELQQGGEKMHFPSLRQLDITCEHDIAADNAKFVERLDIALEERKKRGKGLKKVTWCAPVLEECVRKFRAIHLA